MTPSCRRTAATLAFLAVSPGLARACPSCAGQSTQQTSLLFVGLLIVLPVFVAFATGTAIALMLRRQRRRGGLQ